MMAKPLSLTSRGVIAELQGAATRILAGQTGARVHLSRRVRRALQTPWVLFTDDQADQFKNDPDWRPAG